jgi:uncharacterized membrane protein YhfC
MNGLFLLQGVGMIVVGLLPVLYWKWRSRVPTVFFLWGGLSWFVAIVLKSIAAMPLPQIIPRLREAAPAYLSEPLLGLFVGLLTGVFECGVALTFVYWLRRLRAASWHEALSYSIGFGALETVLLGFYSFILITLVITIPNRLPLELLKLIDLENASILVIPVPIIERAIVMLLHTFSTLLIVFAVQKNEWLWFWISFLYKMAMDTIAGYFQITYGVQNLSVATAWVVELILLPFGLIGLQGLLLLRNRWPVRVDDPIESDKSRLAAA